MHDDAGVNTTAVTSATSSNGASPHNTHHMRFPLLERVQLSAKVSALL